MEYTFFEIFFSIIGRIYLKIRYKDKDRISFIKDRKYAGHFSNAGRIIVINSLAILFGILLFGLLITVFYSAIIGE